MKILIDEGMSNLVKLTGIGHQGVNLFKHLSTICEAELTDYWYFKFVPRLFRRFIYIAWVNMRIKFYKYDVIHYQNYYIPVLQSKAKKIVTIHDLGAFKYPDTIPFLYVKYNQHSIKQSIEYADAIVTPSESIKKEILEMFSSVHQNKIYVCEDGIRDIFFELNDQRENHVIQKIEPFSYFFFLGSLSRRKNLKFILDGFINARKRGAISQRTYLVLGGQQWWGSSDFKHLLKEEYGIKTLGYLSEIDIVLLYQNCKAFIFPSIYEGFGMPLIEAMSQKIPIIASAIPTSIELNNKHNEQMLLFALGDEDTFIKHLSYIDSNYKSFSTKLDYGDLLRYRFSKIAIKHLELYNKVLANVGQN